MESYKIAFLTAKVSPCRKNATLICEDFEGAIHQIDLGPQSYERLLSALKIAHYKIIIPTTSAGATGRQYVTILCPQSSLIISQSSIPEPTLRAKWVTMSVADKRLGVAIITECNALMRFELDQAGVRRWTRSLAGEPVDEFPTASQSPMQNPQTTRLNLAESECSGQAEACAGTIAFARESSIVERQDRRPRSRLCPAGPCRFRCILRASNRRRQKCRVSYRRSAGCRVS
jgi:hypothetical protein